MFKNAFAATAMTPLVLPFITLFHFQVLTQVHRRTNKPNNVCNNKYSCYQALFELIEKKD